MVRRQGDKAAPAVDDMSQLPVVVSDKPSATGPSVLARTTGGGLVSAPSSSVVQPWEESEMVRRAASASAAGSPLRARPSSAGSGWGSPTKLQVQGAGGWDLHAAVGYDAAAAMKGGGEGKAAQERQAREQLRAVKQQIASLEKEAGGGKADEQGERVAQKVGAQLGR